MTGRRPGLSALEPKQSVSLKGFTLGCCLLLCFTVHAQLAIMPSLQLTTLLLPLLLHSQIRSVYAGIDGFFHTGSTVLVQECADPIISPGKRSGHAHTVFGGNAFNLALGENTLEGSTCTTNSIEQDKSAYWVS